MGVPFRRLRHRPLNGTAARSDSITRCDRAAITTQPCHRCTGAPLLRRLLNRTSCMGQQHAGAPHRGRRCQQRAGGQEHAGGQGRAGAPESE
jgi:hypothetical protein